MDFLGPFLSHLKEVKGIRKNPVFVGRQTVDYSIPAEIIDYIDYIAAPRLVAASLKIAGPVEIVN